MLEKDSAGTLEVAREMSWHRLNVPGPSPVQSKYELAYILNQWLVHWEQSEGFAES